MAKVAARVTESRESMHSNLRDTGLKNQASAINGKLCKHDDEQDQQDDIRDTNTVDLLQNLYTASVNLELGITTMLDQITGSIRGDENGEVHPASLNDRLSSSIETLENAQDKLYRLARYMGTSFR